MTAEHTELIQEALANIKALLGQIGDGVLDATLVEWLEHWDGESALEERDSDTFETATGTITVGRTIDVDGDARPVLTIVRIDNITIVIYDGNEGDSHGDTTAPENPDDRVLVRLDWDDIQGDAIALKIVLFHELVHVGQVREWARNGPGTFESNKDVFEASAHLQTMFFCALVLQQHPENEESVWDKYKVARDQLDRYREELERDENKAVLDELRGVKSQLHDDITELNNELSALAEQLTDARNGLRGQLRDLADNLPTTKASDALKSCMRDTKRALDEALGKIRDFERAKGEAMATNAEVLEDLEEYFRLMRELEEAEAALPDAEGDERRELRERIRELRRTLLRLRRDLGRRVRAEVGELKDAYKDARKARDCIEDAVDALEKLLDEAIPATASQAIADTLARLRQADVKLGLLDFKLELLADLEAQVSPMLRATR